MASAARQKQEALPIGANKARAEGAGRLDSWDHLRVYVRAWWIWLATALVLFQTGAWYAALVAGSSPSCFTTLRRIRIPPSTLSNQISVHRPTSFVSPWRVPPEYPWSTGIL